MLKRASVGPEPGPGGTLEATDGSGVIGGLRHFLAPWELSHHQPRMQIVSRHSLEGGVGGGRPPGLVWGSLGPCQLCWAYVNSNQIYKSFVFGAGSSNGPPLIFGKGGGKGPRISEG